MRVLLGGGGGATDFIVDTVSRFGKDGVILGLSGGY